MTGLGGVKRDIAALATLSFHVQHCAGEPAFGASFCASLTARLARAESQLVSYRSLPLRRNSPAKASGCARSARRFNCGGVGPCSMRRSTASGWWRAGHRVIGFSRPDSRSLGVCDPSMTRFPPLPFAVAEG
jgi:hypothetical protein